MVTVVVPYSNYIPILHSSALVFANPMDKCSIQCNHATNHSKATLFFGKHSIRHLFI